MKHFKEAYTQNIWAYENISFFFATLHVYYHMHVLLSLTQYFLEAVIVPDSNRYTSSLYKSTFICIHNLQHDINEPRCEKTGLQGFRPGPTQTRLYYHSRLIEA